MNEQKAPPPADGGRGGIHWKALIISFLGAAFIGPALGLGAALLLTAAVAIISGRAPGAGSLSTSVAIVASSAIFLAAWWVFYRLAKQSLE